MAITEGFQDRKALVLYGTETGNAQEIAEEVERMIERLQFNTTIADFDAISVDSLSNYTICAFVISTTGQGEFPSNSRRFWTSLLRRKLSPTSLSDVKFVIIGLGDSSYPKFNWAARKLEKRLEQLGAKELYEACEGDEQGDEGIDGTFLPWSHQFCSALSELLPPPAGVEAIPKDAPLIQKWRVELLGDKIDSFDTEPGGQIPGQLNGTLHDQEQMKRLQTEQNAIQPRIPPLDLCSSRPDIDRRHIPGTHSVVLTANERLTPQSHWQDVRLLTLTAPEGLSYYPGDALAIIPKNLLSDVNSIIKLMSWESTADIPVKIVSTSLSADSAHYPTLLIPMLKPNTTLTLRSLLVNHFDILAIPRRSFFRRLAAYTTDAFHKERLLEFADPKYLDDYFDYTTRPRRSILEILAEFDSVKIPWQEAVNVLPIMRPRQFSIASGGSLKQISNPSAGHEARIELLVAIVRYKTVIRKIREGVCTRYLAALRPGSTLNVTLRTEGRFHSRSQRQYYEGLSGTHVLIGTGTGLAPLRALIHEKKRMAEQGVVVGPTTLFFGCRSPDADLFFRDTEFATAATTTAITATDKAEVPSNFFAHDFQLITAFSRFPTPPGDNNKGKKSYVQDCIRHHADLVFERIYLQAATVVICGSSGMMPRSVREALADTLAIQGMEEGQEGARGYLAEMEKVGRLREETW